MDDENRTPTIPIQLKPVSSAKLTTVTAATPTTFSSIAANDNEISLTPQSSINTDHIQPKSIIEKFEQLSKFTIPTVPSSSSSSAHTLEAQHLISSQMHSKKHSSNSNITMGAASLTYVSSMQSNDAGGSASPTFEDLDNDETYNQDYDDEDVDHIDEDQDEVVYEEVLPPPPTQYQHQEYTSLFGDETELTSGGNGDEEDDDVVEYDYIPSSEAAVVRDSDALNGKLSSCSSYTGSLMNQDDFEDIDDQSYDEELADTIYKDNETLTQLPELVVCHPALIGFSADCSNSTESAAVPPPALSSSSAEILEQPALFSIKEYRKQKRVGGGGGVRRSSIAPRTNANALLGKASRSSKATSAPLAPNSILAASEAEEQQARRAKCAERVKELEELIKQEDNVIHQTGVALEKCMHDAHFSGSGEHIECNRLLLISCQKRQAYMTEINRLKLPTTGSIKKGAELTTAFSSSPATAGDELSSTDLTGLLIFSDLQLPVKESYINRLKAGDEKRVFYFLCLIRNGVQVLQTQVMSVQELIGSRDTSITFPNRMAINNVDINFKVLFYCLINL